MTAEADAVRAAIEEALTGFLPSRSPIAQPLVDAMRYAALGGGKRLRPMLTCASCMAFGGRLEDALPPACAVELIHAYSLVHDDLPAMDDDALRRGKPSCHAAYGEAVAILVGDALQALAFEVLAGAPGGSAANRAAALSLLAEAVGWRGMVGGQAFDMASEGQRLGLAELKALHAAKTGALLSAAVQVGALFANASEAQMAVAKAFGDRVGLGFQIIDDVLDVTSDTATLGKPAGSDQQADKSTFVTLMSLDEARQEARALSEEATSLLQQAGLQDTLLAELGRQAVERIN
ncbi:MAG: polyprenyl synthetase family protein [Gammaproteobacteria bacterium]|nr:polyprenyl synthetase family protein [Gammaproteobacteria bacterium]MYK29913.1 polyprenyl synthetase family protein [Gammaproteobacteria bacterium]